MQVIYRFELKLFCHFFQSAAYICFEAKYELLKRKVITINSAFYFVFETHWGHDC